MPISIFAHGIPINPAMSLAIHSDTWSVVPTSFLYLNNHIEKFVTEENICDILNKYDEVLMEKRKKLIKKYLLSNDK